MYRCPAPAFYVIMLLNVNYMLQRLPVPCMKLFLFFAILFMDAESLTDDDGVPVAGNDSVWSLAFDPSLDISRASIPTTDNRQVNRFLLNEALRARRHEEPNSLLQQPWHRKTFLHDTHERLFKRSKSYVDMPVVDKPQPSNMGKPSRPRVPFAALEMAKHPWPQDEDLMRHKSLLRWRKIIESDITTSKTGLQIEEAVNRTNEGSVAFAMIQDVFAKKSTATLQKRSGDMLRYSMWCLARGVSCPWRLSEETVYQYVTYLKDNKARPTCASSFVSALRFSAHTYGLEGVVSALSPRVLGSSEGQFMKRKPIKQALPLTVKQVYALETAAAFHEDMQLRFAAGYMCFCLFACCRFRDPMFGELWTLDMPSEHFGYVECKTRRHKTANIVRQAAYLPLVAFTCGLSNRSWGSEFFRLRDLFDPDDGFAGQYVLPAILRNGLWAQRPMTTSEGTQILRELLQETGSSVEGISTHSLKTTLLSWAAKAQMDISDRRLLGHHVDPSTVSPLTYSRDALAGPLEKLWQIVCRVKEGRFLPDESRAARALKNISLNSGQVSAQSEVHNCEIHMTEQVASTECTDPVVYSSDSECRKSSSDLSDVSDVPDDDEEAALIASISIQREVAGDLDNVYINRSSGLGHMMLDDAGVKFICGRTYTEAYKSACNIRYPVHMCLKCRPSQSHMQQSDEASPM